MLVANSKQEERPRSWAGTWRLSRYCKKKAHISNYKQKRSRETKPERQIRRKSNIAKFFPALCNKEMSEAELKKKPTHRFGAEIRKQYQEILI